MSRRGKSTDRAQEAREPGCPAAGTVRLPGIGKGSGSGVLANWHLYVIRTVDGFLYAGITTDVQRRYREHLARGRKASKYLVSHRPATLALSLAVGGKGLALKVEYRFKRLSRRSKERVIASGRMDFDPHTGKIKVPG